MDQLDIWRVARLLVKQQGAEEALSFAAGRAADSRARATSAALVFKAVFEAIREWERVRRPGDAVN